MQPGAVFVLLASVVSLGAALRMSAGKRRYRLRRERLGSIHRGDLEQRRHRGELMLASPLVVHLHHLSDYVSGLPVLSSPVLDRSVVLLDSAPSQAGQRAQEGALMGRPDSAEFAGATGEGNLLPEQFVGEGSTVLGNITLGPDGVATEQKRYVRAGPRLHIRVEPSSVRAAIATCGGLCPGMNVVIRELVMCLHYNYHVPSVYGAQYGYRGFYQHDLVELTPNIVAEIHNKGGSVLKSSRGGFELDRIIAGLQKHGINQVYLIGGDGTHRGAQKLFEEIKQRKLPIQIVAIPKTVDNDIPLIDKSFGFDTAVQEAQKSIDSAHVEAKSAPNGIGLVKLMGRHSGFIAMYSTLSNRDVNICLIPESPFCLFGPHGLLEYIRKRLLTKQHAVIVVAEGAGSAIQDMTSRTVEVDASGNAIPEDIGAILREQIKKFASEQKLEITLKYLDPTYAIRSVRSNASDTLYCSNLAQNAVHGAFAGFTGFSSGVINTRSVYLPLQLLGETQHVDTLSRHWSRVLNSTGQPSFMEREKTRIRCDSTTACAP